MFGQNKTPQAMGFFGQPLAAGSAVAGIGPSGGNTWPDHRRRRDKRPTGGGSGLFSHRTEPPTRATTRIDWLHRTTGQQRMPPVPMPNGNPTSGTGRLPAGTSRQQSGSSSNATGSGQTFGGAGIIGFSPQSPKQSILIYKKKNHYNEWEFLYSPHDGSADDGWRKHWRGRPARQRHDNSRRKPGDIGTGTNRHSDHSDHPTPTTPQQ